VFRQETRSVVRGIDNVKKLGLAERQSAGILQRFIHDSAAGRDPPARPEPR